MGNVLLPAASLLMEGDWSRLLHPKMHYIAALNICCSSCKHMCHGGRRSPQRVPALHKPQNQTVFFSCLQAFLLRADLLLNYFTKMLLMSLFFASLRAIVNHFNPKIESYAAVNHISQLSEEQVNSSPPHALQKPTAAF